MLQVNSTWNSVKNVSLNNIPEIIFTPPTHFLKCLAMKFVGNHKILSSQMKNCIVLCLEIYEDLLFKRIKDFMMDLFSKFKVEMHFFSENIIYIKTEQKRSSICWAIKSLRKSFHLGGTIEKILSEKFFRIVKNFSHHQSLLLIKKKSKIINFPNIKASKIKMLPYSSKSYKFIILHQREP